MSLRPRKKCSVALTQELLYRWKEHLISTMSTWRMKQVLMILNLISRKETCIKFILMIWLLELRTIFLCFVITLTN